jgi:hypothetical protein
MILVYRPKPTAGCSASGRSSKVISDMLCLQASYEPESFHIRSIRVDRSAPCFMCVEIRCLYVSLLLQITEGDTVS